MSSPLITLWMLAAVGLFAPGPQDSPPPLVRSKKGLQVRDVADALERALRRVGAGR